jgi:hypothetical protein
VQGARQPCRAGGLHEERDRAQRGLQPHLPPRRHAHRRGTAHARRRYHPAPPVLGRDGAPLCAMTEPKGPRFACTCSRERVGRMLRGLGPRGDRQHLGGAGARGDRLRFLAERTTTSTRSTWGRSSRRGPITRRRRARCSEAAASAALEQEVLALGPPAFAAPRGAASRAVSSGSASGDAIEA